MKGLIREAGGYGIASLFALAADISLLWVFVNFCSLPYLIAATFSYLAGAVVAYLLSVRLAFKEHRFSNRRAEFVSFVAIGTIGLVVNAAVIELATVHLGVNYLLAKCMAAACTFACNFVARRQLLFVRPSGVPLSD